MGKSLFKLTSLNLNGIRSATGKGVEAWIAKSTPDCICVQEVKAQAADVEGRFEEMAGPQGHFHFAQKKGYSGEMKVALEARHLDRKSPRLNSSHPHNSHALLCLETQNTRLQR